MQMDVPKPRSRVAPRSTHTSLTRSDMALLPPYPLTGAALNARSRGSPHQMHIS
jgi:hypothetical protein